MPPEDAGLHSNHVCYPRGIEYFYLWQPESQDWLSKPQHGLCTYLLTGDICHSFGFQIVLLVRVNCDAHLLKGKARHSLSMSLPAVVQSCAVAICRASDVWCLASEVHNTEYGPKAAVVWLLWNNPEVLNLTLVLLDLLWATRKPLISQFFLLNLLEWW